MKTLAPEALRLGDWINPGDRVLVAHSTGEPITLLEALVVQRADYPGARPFMHASFSGIVKPEHADHLVLQGLSAIGTQRVLAPNRSAWTWAIMAYHRGGAVEPTGT